MSENNQPQIPTDNEQFDVAKRAGALLNLVTRNGKATKKLINRKPPFLVSVYEAGGGPDTIGLCYSQFHHPGMGVNAYRIVGLRGPAGQEILVPIILESIQFEVLDELDLDLTALPDLAEALNYVKRTSAEQR